MITVAVGIILKGNSVLVVKRPRHQSLPGKWHLPGGKQEWGEQLHQTLSREIKEELNLAISVGEQLARVYCRFEHGDYDLNFFRVTGWIGQLKLDPDSCEEMQWLNIDMLDTVDWLPLDKQVAHLALVESQYK